MTGLSRRNKRPSCQSPNRRPAPRRQRCRHPTIEQAYRAATRPNCLEIEERSVLVEQDSRYFSQLLYLTTMRVARDKPNFHAYTPGTMDGMRAKFGLHASLGFQITRTARIIERRVESGLRDYGLTRWAGASFWRSRKRD
jgi:hypothetical protein